jgi:hypothetical protein
MVRKRSWPAVSHCKAIGQQHEISTPTEEATHDLQLHRLAVELNSTDFLARDGPVSLLFYFDILALSSR